VITQFGVYGFEAASKRMQLLALHPGVTVDQVQAESGFEIMVTDPVGVTQPPSEEDRIHLRQIDPAGMVIGK
jgi:glutaconate CoA-transferase subunit B